MISNCFSRMTGRFCACTQKDIPKSNSKKRHFSFICFFSVESANIIKPLIFLVQKSCIFKIKSYLCNAFNKKHFWKEVLERWQSGRLRRSWKPLYCEVPGVRIPVSPLSVKDKWRKSKSKSRKIKVLRDFLYLCLDKWKTWLACHRSQEHNNNQITFAGCTDGQKDYTLILYYEINRIVMLHVVCHKLFR